MINNIRAEGEKYIKDVVIDMLATGEIDQQGLAFVERPMYFAAMEYTRGNQVKAAKLLGISRGTLRTKLKEYFGATKVGGLYHPKPEGFIEQAKVTEETLETATI